jgi:hypothetical protein
MGNIVSDINNDLHINNKLSDFIKEWASNDYDAGLNYIKSQNHDDIKFLLKKRACCTRNNNMIIALPIIEITNLTNPILPGYKPIKVKAFLEENDLTVDSFNITKCQFRNEATPNNPGNQQYYQTTVTPQTPANSACSALYTSDGVDLCGSVKNDRFNTYFNSRSKTAYGYYALDPKVLIDNKYLDNLNNYTDCNCKNSMLKGVNIQLMDGSSNFGVEETAIQSIDQHCSRCLSGGKCYISTYERATLLCVNLATFKENTVENNSNIKNDQNCSIKFGNQAGSPESPVSPGLSGASGLLGLSGSSGPLGDPDDPDNPESESTSILSILEKNFILISILISFIIITIISAIIIL